MRRLTHRDKEGRACWRAELLADDTGEAGALILETVADYEDRLEKIDTVKEILGGIITLLAAVYSSLRAMKKSANKSN